MSSGRMGCTYTNQNSMIWGSDNDFLDTIPKAQATKEKTKGTTLKFKAKYDDTCL